MQAWFTKLYPWLHETTCPSMFTLFILVWITFAYGKFRIRAPWAYEPAPAPAYSPFNEAI